MKRLKAKRAGLHRLETLEVRQLLSSVAGQIFFDFNGNHRQEPGEHGVANGSTTIFLDTNQNNNIDASDPTWFNSSEVPLVIPDRNLTGTTSHVSVSGMAGLVNNLRLTLTINHTFDRDLTAYLQSPTGRRITLFSHVGGSGDNFTATTFDDAAGQLIGSATPPFTGSYLPLQALNTFNGDNPNGTWSLQVVDDTGADVGTLQSWSLQVTSAEPATQNDPFGLYQFDNLAAGAYQIRFLPEAGTFVTTPPGAVRNILLADNQFLDQQNFGVTQTGLISGRVYQDTNANYLLNPGEPALSGRRIYADTLFNGQYDTRVDTFRRQNLSTFVPDRGAIADTITTRGLGGNIQKVKVNFTIETNNVHQIDAFLVSPAGIRLTLVSALDTVNDVNTLNFSNTTFDDQAQRAIGAGSAPFTGSFRPHDALSALQNLDPNGIWQLVIRDTVNGGFIKLKNWSLELTHGDISSISDAQGNYFLTVPPGRYFVREVLPAGWQLTEPFGGIYDLTLGSEDIRPDRNFGNLLPDPDDQFTEAHLIRQGQTLRGFHIDPAPDVDMFKFTAIAGQRLGFNINRDPGSNLDSYIRLFNSAGLQLAANNNGAAPGERFDGRSAYLEYDFTQGGTYYLGVSGWPNAFYNPRTGLGDRASTTTGGYSLQLLVRPDPDDQLSEARLISTNFLYSGLQIAPAGDVDMFKFVVSAGRRVSFDINRSPGSNLNSYLRLFDRFGNQLAANNNGTAPGERPDGLSAYLVYRFANAGVYYLGVSGFNNTAYNPVTGGGDRLNSSIGGYSLRTRRL